MPAGLGAASGSAPTTSSRSPPHLTHKPAPKAVAITLAQMTGVTSTAWQLLPVVWRRLLAVTANQWTRAAGLGDSGDGGLSPMTRFGFLVFGAATILTAAGCGSISMGTPVTSAPAQSSSTGSQATPTATSQFLAVGTSTKLTGESSGEKYEVTLTSVVDPATESDGLSLLPSGDRLVAVNLTVANAGTGIQQESIDDDVTLIDSGGHTYSERTASSTRSRSARPSAGQHPSARPERARSSCSRSRAALS